MAEALIFVFIKNKGLERSLKMEIPQTIYEHLEKEFEELENT